MVRGVRDVRETIGGVDEGITRVVRISFPHHGVRLMLHFAFCFVFLFFFFRVARVHGNLVVKWRNSVQVLPPAYTET